MKFEEFTKPQKEALIQAVMTNNTLLQFMEQRFENLVKGEYKPFVELRYSLAHCQGDGVSFVGRIEQTELKGLPFAPLLKDIENSSVSFIGNRLDAYYCYSKTVDVVIDVNEDIYSEEELEELVCVVRNWFDDVCKQLEQEGYAFLNLCEKKETIAEFLAKQKFDKDGHIM